MSRRCELLGTGPASGNKVSHSNIKTRTRWLPNVQDKRYQIPEIGQVVRVRLCTRAIRTIDKKGGFTRALMDAKTDGLSERLVSIRNRIATQRKKGQK